MRRAPLLLLLALLLAGAGFDDPVSDDPGQQFAPGNVQRADTPTDPSYDRAEPDDETAGVPDSTNLFDERFDLFGFPSARTRATAIYSEGPNALKPQVSGFNAAGAWKLTRGRPDVSVAILDTGINWDNGGVRDKVALNRAELPPPGQDDGDGALDVDDYAQQVGKAKPTGQDLIQKFSDGADDDGNGYVDDIAGWDFFDDDNDPADASSYFAAENHGSGRTSEAVERSNDGEGELGVCPKCQHVPLRIWDTFVSDQNNFAMAITYAADNDVEVIEGADGGLYHSAFAEQASRYAYEKGVAQLYSGDDLNTGNHNFPAAYTHAQLVEGTAADVKGLGMDLPTNGSDPGFRGLLARIFNTLGPGTSAPLQTYFRGANTTQFGGKSSISMEGATGSTNTGKAAGAAALVISAAKEKGTTLTADETRELLEQTAEDVLPGNTRGTGVPDPSQPGFDTHFGYGRVNLGEAVRAASTGNVPPEASIASPDWYAPVTGDAVALRGLAQDRTRPGEELTWTVEYGVGLAPKAFTKVREGKTRGTVTDFGTVPLADVRAALAARTTFEDRDDPAGPTLDRSDPKLDPYRGQFTVRLRVRSGRADTLLGEDRKVLTAIDPVEQKLRPGFPKRLGTGGEAPLRYADLDGDNVQELVLPTEDGRVHAFRPDGSELPGWPVRTRTQFSAERHLDSPALTSIAPPLEPPRAATLADLTGDGRPEVITAAGERIYAWDFRGRPLDGWPVRPDPERANCAQSEQRKGDQHPKCGFLSSPSVARLEGPSRPFAVVVPGLDGRLRAYRADATPVPNFPVRLIDPTEAEKITAESINNPAIGDLDSDGFDDVVVPTNEVYGSAGGANDVSFAGALASAGTTSRVYAVSGRTGEFLPGWPIKLGGIIQDVLPLIGPGHDPSLVRVGGEQQVVVSTTGGSLSLYSAQGTLTRELSGLNTGALNLFESAAVGDLDGTGPAVVKYQIDPGQAANLLLVGQNFPYSHRIGAFDAATGAAKAGYPNVTDDYQFLSSSTVAQVRPGATNQVLAGTGLGLLHAYDGAGGRDVAGFPKVTGGWLFAPAALSSDGRLAGLTREGYLFEWDAPEAPECQTEWPSFRHDEQGTGNYDADGTPPAAPDALGLEPLGGDRFRLTFRSPGDDGFCGTPTRYLVDVDGTLVDAGAPEAGKSAVAREITVPASARRVTIRAADGPADGAFNLGAPGSLERRVDPESGVEGGGPFVPVAPQDAGSEIDARETPKPAAPGVPRPVRTPLAVPGARPVAPRPAAPAGAKLTAKLGVSRARVLRGSRRLDVRAPITRRASGTVRVAFRAAGRTVRFSAPITPSSGRVAFRRRLPARMARRGTGILTLVYPGDADTRPQTVRLRAAGRPAGLTLARPRVQAGRLLAAGTVTRRARGRVRVQLEYDLGGRTITLERNAPIRRGRWSLSTPAPADLTRRTGTLHSYVLFTGDERRGIRGELRSFQVAP